MLASGSSPSASTAASRMRAMLRSASARRVVRLVEEVMVVLVDSDPRSDAQLGKEGRRGGQHEQRDDAGGASDDAGDQEGVPEAIREHDGRSRSAGLREAAGGDGDQDGDAQGATDLMAGGVQAGQHPRLVVV